MTRPRLLLLIPAYNEERRIEPVLRDYASFFAPRYGDQFRLVVVLNGCRDDTLGVVQRVARDHPCVHWLEFEDAIGKGGALIEGLRLAGQCDAIGFVDADGATAPPAFHALVERLPEADAVIGSRWLPGAVIHNLQTGQRRFASRVFHLIVQLLFWMNVRDTQCGAKVVKSAAIEQIHPKLRIADMAFDINLLYSLKHARYRVLEVPTEWTDKAGSKVQFFRTSLTMFLSALRIRLIYSPLYEWMRPLRPLEYWVYAKLRAPLMPPASGRTPMPKSTSITFPQESRTEAG